MFKKQVRAVCVKVVGSLNESGTSAARGRAIVRDERKRRLASQDSDGRLYRETHGMNAAFLSQLVKPPPSVSRDTSSKK